MIRKLTAAKAIAAAIGAGGVVFNRGNVDVASIAILVFAVLVFAVEILAMRERIFVAIINFIGLILTITFATVMGNLKEPFDRFYMLVLIVSLFQLLSETVINFSKRWAIKGNVDHIVNWSLHLILWIIFGWVQPDLIGAVGVFGAYCAILAVHWGIEATGPKPLKQD
ncbi:unannotated protein [freshwater metagenome]|uniref:Unannotated protein n=1 Tax=freshwater metagenome TaxID=449393 RepID=A0A6J7JT95_9ZZZZ|nr:hypothetical protein [Actinomycetota bacterium]